MLERMGKSEQEKLLTALDSVSDLVENSGVHPNEAITKIAMEKQLPAGHVRLMVTAFNTGRSNHHRKQASSVLDKAASVPMADPAVVLENLFPSKIKSAAAQSKTTTVSSDYSTPYVAERATVEVKSAADLFSLEAPPLPKDETRKEKRAFNVLRDYEKLLNEKTVEMERAKQAFTESYKEACEAVRLAQPTNWYEIRNNVNAALGKNAEVITKHVEAANSSIVKKASETKHEEYDEKKSPYKEIRRCVISMTVYQGAKKDLDKLGSHPEFKKLQEIFNLTPEKKADEEKKKAPPKAPGIFSSTMKGFGGGLSKGWEFTDEKFQQPLSENVMKPLDSLNFHDKLLEQMSDPYHDHELRKIRTKAMLSDMLSNDPVLSEYGQKEVVDAFNELQRMAPRVTDEPAAARVLLRKMMAQGGFDTHEIKQLADTENTVANARKLPQLASGIPMRPKLNISKYKESLPRPTFSSQEIE